MEMAILNGNRLMICWPQTYIWVANMSSTLVCYGNYVIVWSFIIFIYVLCKEHALLLTKEWHFISCIIAQLCVLYLIELLLLALVRSIEWFSSPSVLGNHGWLLMRIIIRGTSLNKLWWLFFLWVDHCKIL